MTYEQQLAELDRNDLRRVRREFTPLGNGWFEQRGEKLLDCASNDYLGLSFDPRMLAAAREAIHHYGTSARASSLISGRGPAMVALEQAIAKFEQTDAAIVFPTGYAANLGTITSLLGTEDVVFCDRLNHACLIDGCRLSGAKLRVYRHDDLERLERELQKSEKFRRRMIVTDGVFSMDGDLAPLRELSDLAERYDAALMVDEAHGTGVFGASGRGAAEELGVVDRVAIRMGTLSKALGSQGGFVAGSGVLIDWLWNSARTNMFSTGLNPASCAAASTALHIISEEPRRRRQLRENARFLRRLLIDNGWDVLGHSESPIIPVLLNNSETAVRYSRELQDRGFLVAAIRPPTVPQGASRLRITVSTLHHQEELQRLTEVMSEIRTTFSQQGEVPCSRES